jgi:hypothetical protein
MNHQIKRLKRQLSGMNREQTDESNRQQNALKKVSFKKVK